MLDSYLETSVESVPVIISCAISIVPSVASTTTSFVLESPSANAPAALPVSSAVPAIPSATRVAPPLAAPLTASNASLW